MYVNIDILLCCILTPFLWVTPPLYFYYLLHLTILISPSFSPLSLISSYLAKIRALSFDSVPLTSDDCISIRCHFPALESLTLDRTDVNDDCVRTPSPYLLIWLPI